MLKYFNQDITPENLEKYGFTKYSKYKEVFWQKTISQTPLIVAKLKEKNDIIAEAVGIDRNDYKLIISCLTGDFGTLVYKVNTISEILLNIDRFDSRRLLKLVVRYLMFVVISFIICMLLAIFG